MKIRLGYACVPITINETSSSTITYTYYRKLGLTKGNIKLNDTILSNFESLKSILNYNINNDIYFFRMTSNLIPLVNHPNIEYEVFDRYKYNFKLIGSIIKKYNMRVDMHPDQFCVLNSINNEVVESTINILKFYQKMYKYMGIDSNLILHIGGKSLGKKEGMIRFINNFNKLDNELQKMIVIENDDKVYNIRNVLSISKKLGIPVVLDYHHFKCNKNNEKIEDYIEKIFNTWNDKTPKIHFSSSKSKKEFRAHSEYIDCMDFINFIEKIKFINKDFDVMIEAKAKDDALFRLVRQLKYYNYKVINTTIYID